MRCCQWAGTLNADLPSRGVAVVTPGLFMNKSESYRLNGETDPGGGPRSGHSNKETKPNVFSIRGTKEWREWLARFAIHQRMTPTALVDHALAEAARRAGFEEPPPRA